MHANRDEVTLGCWLFGSIKDFSTGELHGTIITVARNKVPLNNIDTFHYTSHVKPVFTHRLNLHN